MNMRIILSKKDEAFVLRKVKDGEFNDASEIVSAALGQLRAREQAKRQRLRAAIQKGLDDYEAGNYETVELKNLRSFLRGLVPDKPLRKGPKGRVSKK